MTGYFESLINDVPGNADSLTSLAAEWDTYGNHCDGLADDLVSSVHLAPEWAGSAHDEFFRSIKRQRNRYINLGGDCTTASSAISVYAGAVRAGQSYIENLRYQASKLDEEVDNAPVPLLARAKTRPQPAPSFLRRTFESSPSSRPPTRARRTSRASYTSSPCKFTMGRPRPPDK